MRRKELGWMILLPGLFGAVGLFFATSTSLADWFAGFDANGDVDCEATDFDRGRFYPQAEIGTTDSFKIFFEGPDPILTVGCVFCVTVDSLIGTSVMFDYSLASGWTPVPIAEEESAAFVVSESFSAAYPSHRCWMVQGGDFAGSNPVSTYPYVIGTFTYQVAKEGGIHFAFDTGEGGQGVAVLTTGFSSIIFTQSQVCNYPISTPPACPTPTLFAPQDLSIDLDTSGTLDWSDVSGASSYEVQIGPACGSGQTYPASSSQFHYTGLTHSTTYYWRVRTACGSLWSSFSACRSFTTSAPPQCSPPVLLVPPNHATGVATPVTLDWSDVIGASSYQVQIGEACGAGPTVMTGASQFHYDGLESGGVYFWRVRTLCGETLSAFTSCNDFTTFSEGRYEVVPDTAILGKDLVLAVRGSNNAPIKGYSLLIRFDPAVFAVGPGIVDTIGTAASGARILSSAATDTTAKAGVVFSYGCPPSIPEGEHTYMKFHLHVKPGAPLGPTTVEILDIPPTRNRMTRCDGSTLVPARIPGTITIFREAFTRGDADGDGAITITDPITNLAYQFMGGSLSCLDAADDDDNGEVNISDPIYSLAYQFEGGAEFPGPYPWCDPDPTTDALACVCNPSCMACSLGTFRREPGATTEATLMVNGIRRTGKDRVLYTLYLRNDTPLWGFEYTFRYPPSKLRFEHIAGNDFEFSSGRAAEEGDLVRIGNVVSMSLSGALSPGIHGIGQLEFTSLQKADEDQMLEFVSGLCALEGGGSGTVVLGVISGVPSAEAGVPRSIAPRITPNPFNPETTVHFAVPVACPVRIEIYNTSGQRVRLLLEETKKPGFHAATWNGLDDRGAQLGSGVFFCRIRVGGLSETRKLVLVR